MKIEAAITKQRGKMPALKKTTRAATGSGRKGLKMNERNNLKEILQRSREGRMFDQEGLRKVVQNFLYTPFPELILSNSNGYNIEAFEWSKAIFLSHLLERVGKFYNVTKNFLNKA